MKPSRLIVSLALCAATPSVACRPIVPPPLPSASPQSLPVVGRNDLGGTGLNGNVAIVGTTAIVAAGITPAAGVHTHLYNPYPCPPVTVKVVDVSTPTRPRVVATIPVDSGVAAVDVAALRVATPSFRGDLAAIALAQCNIAGSHHERGIVYYDVTDATAPRFLGRYAADADSIHPPSIPPCGPPPAGSGRRCAASQHSVRLAQRDDGRVLSLSVEPGASASRFPSGDLRIVDVTNPRRPAQVGAFPARGAPIFSTNGCRPFSAGHDASFADRGMRAVIAWVDGGVRIVDLAAPDAPRELAGFTLPSDRAFEGNIGYVATGTIDGRQLVIASEEDWIAPTTILRIDSPHSIAGRHLACQAMFSLFAPGDDVALHRRPLRSISGEIVYVGRGCPANPGDGMHAGTPDTDRYLADPRGSIAFVDRTTQHHQPTITRGAGCSVADRVRRAQEAGALAVILGQTVANTPLAFSPDGDPAGLTIPIVHIDKGIADSLRATLCPTLREDGRCVTTPPVRATLVDSVGSWGALRVLELASAGAPRQVWIGRPPQAEQFPPPDLGVYAPHRAVIDGGRAYVAWNSAGLRVLDLRGDIRETAAYLPRDVADPTGVLPTKAYVVGVASFRVGEARYVAISDINSGLYILRDNDP